MKDTNRNYWQPIKLTVLTALMLTTSQVYAKSTLFSERETISFSYSAQAPSVDISYSGHTFSPELPLLPKNTSKENSSTDENLANRYVVFFDNLRHQYSSNNKDNYLSVWNPDERQSVSNDVSDHQLDQTSNIYANMKGAKLARAIKYGDFTLLYVQHTFGSDLEVMEVYAILDKLDHPPYLTNLLIDDPFFNYISVAFDKRLFQ